jgi:SCY1-like protein 2
MKGLTNVLDRFSEGLRTRKILPSLLEEMKDTHLLPYILPNVFAISHILSPSQFASLVLPSLKPLFAIKEPPQNMITLLDNLQMLQNKTEKTVFRERMLASDQFVMASTTEYVFFRCPSACVQYSGV